MPVPWMRKQGPFDFMRAYLFMLDTWAGETGELTAAEEGVYLRLQNWALRNECDLPADLAECNRIARAVTPSDRRAVQRVVSRLLVKTNHGFSRQVIQKAISVFKDREPVISARRENDAKRQREWRKKQHETAKQARAKGFSVPMGATSKEIDEAFRANGASVDNFVENLEGVTRDEVRYASSDTGVTDGVTDEGNTYSYKNNALITYGNSSEPRAREGEPGQAGAACREMRRVGLVGVNPSHPQLGALLAAGASLDHFAATAASAVARGKGFAWVLAAVAGQMTDGQRMAETLADRQHGEAASVMQQLAPSVAAKR